MVDKKNMTRNDSTQWCPSQSMKCLTQVGKAGVLIPVELRGKRNGSRCYSKGNSDDRLAWSNAGGVMLRDKRLRWNEGRQS
jgi:hypothetical protein